MSSHDELTYAKVSKADIDGLTQTQRDEMFADLVQEYPPERVSEDGLWYIVKWETAHGTPAHMGSVSHTTYTYSGVMTLIDDTEFSNWNMVAE